LPIYERISPLSHSLQPKLTWILHLADLDGLYRILFRPLVKRRFPRQQHVEDDAAAPDVTAAVVLFGEEDFGGDVEELG
jgi:hypothetical protein